MNELQLIECALQIQSAAGHLYHSRAAGKARPFRVERPDRRRRQPQRRPIYRHSRRRNCVALQIGQVRDVHRKRRADRRAESQNHRFPVRSRRRRGDGWALPAVNSIVDRVLQGAARIVNYLIKTNIDRRAGHAGDGKRHRRSRVGRYRQSNHRTGYYVVRV